MTKRNRNRSLRIEELESRDLLSATPFGYYDGTIGNDLYQDALILQAATTAVNVPVTLNVVNPLSSNSLSQADFDEIRTKYADLNLLANVTDYTIIEIAANALTDYDLRAAITEANANAGKNLIVIRTSATQTETDCRLKAAGSCVVG